jgi:hypothetical protein
VANHPEKWKKSNDAASWKALVHPHFHRDLTEVFDMASILLNKSMSGTNGPQKT